MARGAIAKVAVAEELRKAFGYKYIGEYDKKHYVWADDGGETVQIAISLTCPKNMIAVDYAAAADMTAVNGTIGAAGDFNWDDMPSPEPVKAEKISEEELNNIAKLMEQLGL